MNQLSDFVKIEDYEDFDLYVLYRPDRTDGPFSTYYVLAVNDTNKERIGFCQMASAAHVYTLEMNNEENVSEEKI